MANDITAHYASQGDIAAAVEAALRNAGLDMDKLTATDLSAVDEFHIRGRAATLELAASLKLTTASRVLDIGSGLGGPARTLAETYGCHVTGVDLTPAFTEAAARMSGWVGLSDRTDFVTGDATSLPFGDAVFDAAITFHAAMNIPGKAAMYAEAHRALKPGGGFLVYDVMQGPGGDIVYPTPWARDSAISHVETPDKVAGLLAAAGFTIDSRVDSSPDSLAWFEAMAERMRSTAPPPLSTRTFMGPDFPEMAANQIRNLREDRIRTVAFHCTA